MESSAGRIKTILTVPGDHVASVSKLLPVEGPTDNRAFYFTSLPGEWPAGQGILNNGA
jgi:hypothetical protein